MPAFIFDLDGTICDTVPYIINIARQIGSRYGYEESEEQIKKYIGWPLVNVGEELLGAGRGMEYADAFQELYMASDHELTAFPGMISLLHQLDQQGAKLAVCTSKRGLSAEKTLQVIGARPYVQALVYSEMTTEHKPFAAPALKASSLLGAEPQNCLFIGDSRYDIGSGKNAGMKTCAVTWGAGTLQELEAAKPDFQVDTVAELQELLLAW